ncbi:MAG: hypothetical protein J5811_04480 [Lachnospiraceae bacterium]|nr:hypothetical protein [Lachnospiraceae bacterium]
MAQWEIKKTKYSLFKGMLFMANIFVLTFFLEENGMGYLACAAETFSLVAILFTGGMPDTIGKLMRQRIQKSLGKNAIEVYRSATILAILYAILGSIVILAISGLVAKFTTNTEFGAKVIRMFIPAYIMLCLSCPLKGFFIGVGTAAPGSISGIICNLVIFGTSIATVKLGGGYGEKVAALLNNSEFVNAYKAYMIPLAVFAGYLVEFVFLFVTYMTGGRNTRIADRDMSRYHEPASELIGSIAKGMFPINITEFVLRGMLLSIFIILGIFLPKDVIGIQTPVVYIGAIYGKFLSVVVFLGFFIEYMTLCFKNYCIGGIRRNELKFTREKMSEGVHMIFCLGAFLSVAFMTAGSSFLIGCFHDFNLAGTDLFTLGCLILLFLPLSMYFRTFVSYTSKKRASLILAALAFAVSATFLIISGKMGGLGYKGVIIALVIYFVILALGNGFFALSGFKVRLAIVPYIVIPVGTAALSGVIMMLLNKGLINITGGLISFAVCLFVGALGNLILLLALHNLTEEELVSMPMGKAVIKFGVAFNFFDY